MAIKKGNLDIVKLLLSNDKIDINIKCIFYKTYEVISISNHFWNWKQSFNNSPLILASAIGNTEIVDHLLLQPNININIKDILNQKLS